MSEIFINKKQWSIFTPQEKEEYIEEVYQYYKKTGFPYYSTEKNYRDSEFKKLNNYDISNILEDDIIKQTMHGLALAWSYFPHSFDVKCNNQKTPLEAFNDDVMFRKVITKRMNFGDNISDSGIRKMLKLFSGVQAVSNFRPTAAAAIYNEYGNGGVVWDMSGGYGGRLLGAIKSNIKKYICTEPCLKTYNGICDIANAYNRKDLDVEIHMLGSEDFKPEQNSLNLCFTSPPYFDCEKYSNEETQSYMKFPNKKLWVEGFLKKTFENCYYGLRKDGYMLINIANVKSFKDIEEHTITAANTVGFELHKTLKLALSNPNMKNKATVKFKYEPIFVFKKMS